ncbi:MAG: rod shape-determining protein MreC, partial [Kiritimatiellae bacterium]|nr:rod shape-determining protein MreC [Kiritimatiellia bacterium]
MKARTTGAYVLIALGAVATAVVVFSRGTALEAIFPAERASRSFSDKVWSRVKGACHGASASAENVALRREVAALALARDDAARLEAENARLRRVLEYRGQNPETWLVAEVLAAGGALGPRRTMRVGKGSLAGVCEGAVVVVPEGLVGRVESVTPHTSEIRLVTDPSIGVGCEVALPGGGTLRGTLAG